ncbi:MAG: outer membrane beta-barrel protein [Chitinophagaceae bacterium]|nr:outer membrane beta-barrel protein [Chitinophagaceae bacterium]
MKQLFVLLVVAGSFLQARAQDSSAVKKAKKDWSKVNLGNRSKDHILLQLGYNNWIGKPDTIATKGFSRSFNMYFMLDFPFKTDPRISVAFGPGLGFDAMYLNKTYVDVSGKLANKLGFVDQADTNHFKKVKLNTTYLEAPIELRFSKDPENPNKSWKAAIGVKIGTLLSASTKNKTLQSKNGGLINGYTLKEKSKSYFNNTRLSVMARAGYGIYSIYASYQVNAFIKDGFGPNIRPFQVGFTISGL